MVLAGDIGLEFAGLVVAFTISVVIAVRVDIRRGGDLCSPLGLSGLFYLLAFVSGPVFFWFNPDFGQKSPRVLPFDHQALVTATGLCLLAWFGLAFGYFLRPFSFFQIRPLKLDKWHDPSVRKLLTIYGVGWAARFFRIARNEYFHGSVSAVATPTTGSTSGQILLIIAILPSVVVAFAGVMAARERPKLWRLFYVGGLLVEVAYYLPSGGRSYVVTTAVLALIISFYTRGHLPGRMMLATGLILLFVLFPLIHLYRGSGSESGFTTDASGNLQQSASTFAGNGVRQTLLYGVGSTFSRFSDIFVPASLVYSGRQIYQIPPGETLVWSVTNIIPRAIWPNKPSTGTFAGDFGKSIGLVSSNRTAVSTTQPGELFLNFGTIGVFIGMLFVGGVYRELGEWLQERKRKPMVLALYAALAYNIIGSHETIIAQGLTGLVRTAAVIAILLWAVQFFAPNRDYSMVPSRAYPC